MVEGQLVVVGLLASVFAEDFSGQEAFAAQQVFVVEAAEELEW